MNFKPFTIFLIILYSAFTIHFTTAQSDIRQSDNRQLDIRQLDIRQKSKNLKSNNLKSKKGKLEFIENRGQWKPDILYKADISKGAIFIEKNCITYNFVNPADISFSRAHNHYKGTKQPDIVHFHSYKMHLLNSNNLKSNNLISKIYGSYPTKDYCNYFIGKESKKWASNVSKFKTVSYDNVYSNIDMNVYSRGNNLEYDFVVRPGGNVEDIALQYEGLTDLQIKEGELRLKTSFNYMNELKPNAYIQNPNNRAAVSCSFTLKSTDDSHQSTDNVSPLQKVKHLKSYIVKFSVKDYDKSKVLVIDPQLIFSTYSGSTADNWGFTATFDNDNNVYSGGIAFGVGYPVTIGAYQTKFGGGDSTDYYPMGEDIAIIKYDPTGTQRLYATYLGGSGAEMPHSMIVNQFNQLLIFGTTGSDNFPVTPDAYSKSFKGGSPVMYDYSIYFSHGSDMFVAKLSPDGSQLLASTYIGGTANDGLNFRPSDVNYMMEGNDSLYFNYGDDARGEIITDIQNNVYIGSCTFSTDFPVTSSALQPKLAGREEGIVFKLDYNLSNLIWSTFLGGSQDDAIYSIDLAYQSTNIFQLPSIFVTGGTNSTDFPTSSNALNKNYLGGTADAFIAHISQDGTKLLSSTYYGSSAYDQAYFVRTDRYNNPYIAGQTKAPGSTLIYNANYHTPNSGQFIAKLSTGLDSLKWSTVFGSGTGAPNISITAFAVDICNKIYLAGWGREWADIADTLTWANENGTKNMDITPDAIQKITDGQDFYIMVLAPDASQLYYATYFGEIHNDSCWFGGHDHVDGGTSRFDKRGSITESACASCGACEGFPTYPKPGAWSNTNNSYNCNNAVFKINIFKGFALADFRVPQTGCAPYSVNFVNKSQGVHFLWNFGDNSSPSHSPNPSHTYKKSGTYNVTLIAIDSSSCNGSDTITKPLQILSDTTTFLPDIDICKGVKQQIGTPPFNDTTLTYSWTPQTGLSDPYISNPFAYPDNTTNYELITKNSFCIDTIFQKVNVHVLSINPMKDTTVCSSSSFTLTAKASGDTPLSYQWSSNNNFTDTLNTSTSKGTAIIKVNNGKTYYIKVINAFCEQIDSIHINAVKIGFTIAKGKTFTICKGDSLKLMLLNNNPSDPLSYTWSPADWKLEYVSSKQDTAIFMLPTSSLQLPASTFFNITATNKLGCSLKDSIKVIVIKIKADSIVTNPSCFSLCNGNITVFPSGGIKPYTYLWSNNYQLPTINYLCAGNYKLTITDSLGCKFEHLYTIKSPLQLSISIINKKDVVCNEICNGTVTASSSGGTNPYKYKWVNNQTDSIATNLCAGTYSVTVTDNNGCTATTSVEINDTSSLKAGVDTISPKCFSACNGKANAIVSGGNLPYTYLWDDGQKGKSDSTLCAGNHNVLVTEAGGCSRQVFFTLHSPSILHFQFSILNSPTCYGDCNGKVYAQTNGGTPPYAYSWSNGSKTDTVANLCAGTYSLTITDANKCYIDSNTVISNPEKISLSINTTDASCSKICNGSVSVYISGGTPPYYYSWSFDAIPVRLPDKNKQVLVKDLCIGNYSVTVKDSLSCKTSNLFTINDSLLFSNVKLTATPDTIRPGQFSLLTLVCNECPPSSLLLSHYSWSPADGLSSTSTNHVKANPLKTTWYYVTLSNLQGCIFKDSILIIVSNVICDVPYIFVPNAFTPDANINNVLYVRSSVIVKLHFAIYDRWGEQVFESTDMSSGWNGTYKGKKCNPGVFDYYIEATCIDNETYKHKGNITLIR